MTGISRWVFPYATKLVPNIYLNTSQNTNQGLLLNMYGRRLLSEQGEPDSSARSVPKHTTASMFAGHMSVTGNLTCSHVFTAEL